MWCSAGRNAATLQCFLDELGERKQSIRAVSIDMSGGYAKAIRDSVPNAEICFDPFHIVRLGQRAVDQVRRDERNADQRVRSLGLNLKPEKTGITHIDEGFAFLGMKIMRRAKGNRRCVYTFVGDEAFASIERKVKALTGRSTTNLSLSELLRRLNPILRGWAGYFRYAAATHTFSYLGYYVWWRVVRWLRKKHRRMTWKQLRRRYYGKHRIHDKGIVLCNPASMRIVRYRFRGAQIATPWNQATVDPSGARFRRTDHDDRLSGATSKRHSHHDATPLAFVESRMRGNPHVRFGGRRRGNHRPQGRHGASPPTQLKSPDKQRIPQLALLGEFGHANQAMFRAFLLKEELRLLYALEDPALAPAHLVMPGWPGHRGRDWRRSSSSRARSAATAPASSPRSDSASPTGASKASTAAAGSSATAASAFTQPHPS